MRVTHYNSALTDDYSIPVCGENGKINMPLSTKDKPEVTCKRCLKIIAAETK